MSGQQECVLDELSLWMQETICRWLPDANVWYLQDITVALRPQLRRPALGVWYSLIDISEHQTRGIITSYYGDDHLELNALATFPRVTDTNEQISLHLAHLLEDLQRRAGILVPSEALKIDAERLDAWRARLTTISVEPSP